MDDKDNRIPAAESGDFEQWPLPEISAGHIVPAATEAARRRQPEPAHHSLTAAELEQISAEAYAEGHRAGAERGYAEGHTQGHSEGYSQGREQGRAAGAQEIAAAVARFGRLCEQLLQPLDEQRAALQDSLTELTLQLARAVIGRDPVTEPAQIAATVEQALAALPAGADGVDVFLHTADLELLERSEWLRPEWRLVADAGLQPGDLRLRTRHSVVDFTRETRFRQLLAALLEERPGIGDGQPATDAAPPTPDNDSLSTVSRTSDSALPAESQQ